MLIKGRFGGPFAFQVYILSLPNSEQALEIRANTLMFRSDGSGVNRMTVPLNSAAQFICEKSGWTATQLSLQKILYLAHMVHLGRGHGALVPGHFEAWDYGPVHPSLYHKVKAFGAKAIPNVFWSSDDMGDSSREVLSEACDNLLKRSPGELVRNTHWQDGAWAKHYSPGSRNVAIPEADIIAEYKARVGRPVAA